jgi:hypothetical protein
MIPPHLFQRVSQIMDEKGYNEKTALYLANLEIETQAIKKKNAHKVRRVKNGR